MRFGMLPYRHGSVMEDVNLAKLAEEKSFNSYWVPDSVLSRDAYVSLTQIAANTKRLFIGPESGPYIRHPVVTANAVAALDEVSDGRVGLMMAVGHLRSLVSVGIQPHPEAAAVVEEAIRICRGVWSGKSFNHDGVRFKIRNLGVDYGFRNHVPIVVAANDPEMLKFAGTYADGICTNLTPLEHLPKAWGIAKEALKKSDRDTSVFRSYFQPLIALAKTRDEARKSVERIIFHSLFYFYQHDAARESIGLDKEDLNPAIGASMKEMAKAEASGQRIESLTIKCAPVILKNLKQHVADRLLDETVIYGTVEDVTERLKRYEKAGVRDVLIGTISDPDPFKTEISNYIKLIGEEIIPHFSQN